MEKCRECSRINENIDSRAVVLHKEAVEEVRGALNEERFEFQINYSISNMQSLIDLIKEKECRKCSLSSIALAVVLGWMERKGRRRTN